MVSKAQLSFQVLGSTCVQQVFRPRKGEQVLKRLKGGLWMQSWS